MTGLDRHSGVRRQDRLQDAVTPGGGDSVHAHRHPQGLRAVESEGGLHVQRVLGAEGPAVVEDRPGWEGSGSVFRSGAGGAQAPARNVMTPSEVVLGLRNLKAQPAGRRHENPRRDPRYTPPMPQTVPLSKRPLDIAFIAFFAVNFVFVTYMIDLEQLVVADPDHFAYPLWPPAFIVDLVHWWGRHFDPPLMAREAWWRATIWIDQLFFGPFYAVAIYAFAKGRDWIRMPSVVWASVMMTNVTIILFEEFVGRHASPAPLMQIGANASWILFPILMLVRMWRCERPFDARGGTER